MNLQNSWLLRLYIAAAGILYLAVLGTINDSYNNSPFEKGSQLNEVFSVLMSGIFTLLIIVIPFLVITTPIVLYKLIKNRNTTQSSDALSKIGKLAIVVPVVSFVVWILYVIATGEIGV